MKIKCSKCGRPVSIEVPDDTIIRAWIECPDCLERTSEKMKYNKLCDKCAENPDYFKPGEVYVSVPGSECPRCRERWTVRLAMVSSLMMVEGGIITGLYLLQVSYKWGLKFGIEAPVCNFMWVMGIVLLIWFMTSALGKWFARKIGLIEETTNTGEWDYE